MSYLINTQRDVLIKISKKDKDLNQVDDDFTFFFFESGSVNKKLNKRKTYKFGKQKDLKQHMDRNMIGLEKHKDKNIYMNEKYVFF